MSNSEAVSQILSEGAAAPITNQEIAPSEAPPEKEAAPSPSKPEERLSGRLELLMKREQAALYREQTAKKKEQELEARFKRLEEFESVKTNPKKALELLELDYTELTNSILNDGQLPPEVQIKKLREEWERDRQDRDTKEAAKQEQFKKDAEAKEQQAVTNFKTEITGYLEDNSSRYELIKFEGQEELVFDLIDEHYNRTIDPATGAGKIMSISEAADKVEKHLEEKYNKSKSLTKVKALWNMLPKETQEKIVKQEQAKPQGQRTLTNTLSASPTPKRKGPLTDEERVQKAIAYYETTRASRP